MNKILVIEITYQGMYKGQLGYEFCPLFPIDSRKLERFVESKMPTLKGKLYNIDFITTLDIKDYKKYKVYRKNVSY